MANFFRKRKRTPGPNKNELKVMRGRDPHQSRLQDRFPSVEKLSIHFSFATDRGQLLGEEDRVYSADDGCDFRVECPGRCGSGVFSVEKKVDESANARLPVTELSATCAQSIGAGSSELCGCVLKCRIEMRFAPEPVAAPEPAPVDPPPAP
ncbi:MAG: hypothetical protein WC969_01340 [Elusimicrobiota bacterium]|jgi:hypothetical protein